MICCGEPMKELVPNTVDAAGEDGEAIRRLMRQIANLNINANDNYELAAA